MAAGLDLGKQVGPLPLGGCIGYMINRNMAKAPVDPSSQQLTETGVGMGGGQMIYEPPTSGTTPDVVETNASWGRKAVQHLIALNHDPNVADSAISKYLTGRARSAQEAAMIGLVLVALGPPPESVPVVEDGPTTPPTTTARPAAPTGLRVDRLVGRNVLSWVHDGKNVTRFVIEAQVMPNGNTTTGYTTAVPRNNRYSWDHLGFPGGRPTTVRYTVRTFHDLDGTMVGGGSASITAKGI
jgi:hypothetical protein